MSEADTATQQDTATSEAAGESLLEQVMRETRISPNDEWYAPARDGMAAFFAELVRTAEPGEKIHASRVDQMIAGIDARVSKSARRDPAPRASSRSSNRPGAA